VACCLKPDYMSQSGRPLLSNVYNQNAYFSGNRVRTSLVAAVLKAFPIQCTYETQDETLGEDVFYTVWLLVIRDQADKIRESIPCGGGVKYLHRSPASHRRQRKGKSRI
jgi:hypothetical protein